MPLYNYRGDISLICRTLHIPAGSDTTEGTELDGHGLVGLTIPSVFTGTTITFLASTNDDSFLPIYNASGEQLSVAVGPDRFIAFCPGDFVAPRYLKIVSGSTEVDERRVCLLLRGFK